MADCLDLFSGVGSVAGDAMMDSFSSSNNRETVVAVSLALAEVVGQLASINGFPVEPLGGESPDAVLLRGEKLVGDRVHLLQDAETGEPLTLEAHPQLSTFSVRYVEDLIAEE